MRIAVAVTFFPSISQTFVLNQITGLIERGHDVDIFAVSPESGHSDAEQREIASYDLLAHTRYEPPMSGNPLRRVVDAIRLLARPYRHAPRAALRALDVLHHGRDAASLRLLYQGAPFVDDGAYDAILCHFGPSGTRMARLRAAGLVRGRLLTAFHGYDVSRVIAVSGPRVYADLFAEGDVFLPVSDFWRRRLIALGAPAACTVVHPMGIELSRFTFAPRQAAGGTVRLLSVARLVEKKGIEYAVRAAAALHDLGLRLDYTIVGDGPLRSVLEQAARDLGADDIIHFVGARDGNYVMQAMRDAHIFLAPSVTAGDGDMEGIPVSLMEAMATGLPVVATQHSGIPELVRDGVSGFLVPERDEESLARVVAHLVTHPSRWPDLGAAGRAAVVAGHDIDALNDRLVALLAGEIPKAVAAPTVTRGGPAAAPYREGGAQAPGERPERTVRGSEREGGQPSPQAIRDLGHAAGGEAEGHRRGDVAD